MILAKKTPRLHEIFRLKEGSITSVVGAGGKTSTCFRLAQSFQRNVVITTTTHVGVHQFEGCARHFIIQTKPELDAALRHLGEYPLLLTCETSNGITFRGPKPEIMAHLFERWKQTPFTILIEADGARSLPIKAPAEHEPSIPPESQTVIVVAGCSGFYMPLNEKMVHRPQIFSQLVDLELEQLVTPDTVLAEVVHPLGGLKRIPHGAHKVFVINQADTPDLQARAGEIARKAIMRDYDCALVTSLDSTSQEPVVHARFEPVSAAILLDGHQISGFSSTEVEDLVLKVEQIAKMAKSAGCDPVLIVDPGTQPEFSHQMGKLQVKVYQNPDWKLGKSTGYHRVMQSLPVASKAVLIFEVDKPLISPRLLIEMLDAWRTDFSSIVRPLIADRRGFPVLFDHDTFHAFARLQGDQGLQTIINLFRVDYIPWQDETKYKG